MLKFSTLLFPGLVIGPIIATFFSGFANGGVLLYDDNMGVLELMGFGLIASFVIYFLDYIWKKK